MLAWVLNLGFAASASDAPVVAPSQPDYGAGGRYVRKGRLVGRTRILDTVVYAKNRYIADITKARQDDLKQVIQARAQDIQFIPSSKPGTLHLSRAMRQVNEAAKAYLLERTRIQNIERIKLKQLQEDEEAILLLILAGDI